MTSTDFVPRALRTAPKPAETDDRLDGHLRVYIENDGGDFDIETPPDPWSRTHPRSAAHTEIPQLTRRAAKQRHKELKAAQRRLEAERAESLRRMLNPSPAATPHTVVPTQKSQRRATAPDAPPTIEAAPTPRPRAVFVTPPSHAKIALPEAEPVAVATQTATEEPRRGRSITRSIKMLAFLALLAATSMLWYASLGTLVVSRGTALVSGWEVTSIATGSMAPALRVGDMVAFEWVDPADLKAGQIVVFDDPARPGATTAHRLVAINDDGSYTTKGDANQNNDSTPVPAANLKGVVRMVSPFGGYPTMLLGRGEYLQLAALVVVLLGSALVVHGPEPRFMKPRR